jgi:hypothetical protein
MSMGSRAWLTLVAAALVLGGATASAWSRSEGAPGIFTIRSDPRLCPSPRCGGYWVALANGARTRCADGRQSARCYVAEATGASLFDGGLALGRLKPADFGALGPLGILAVDASYAPAGMAPVSGGYYRVVDLGVRCIRAPCFSFRVTQVNGSTRTTASGVDLAAAEATPAQVERAELALHTKNGLLARGRFVHTPDGGRLFRALRFFLRASQPRA